MGKTVLIILLGAVILVSGASFAAFAQGDSTIPVWIKKVAGMWSADKISDNEFITAIQYLIDQDILSVNQKNAEPIVESYHGSISTAGGDDTVDFTIKGGDDTTFRSRGGDDTFKYN